MTKLKDGERLAKLEQQVTDLDRKVSDVGIDVKEIKITMNSWVGVDERLKRVESSAGLWRWLSPTLAAVFGSILTFLIINYLQSK